MPLGSGKVRWTSRGAGHGRGAQAALLGPLASLLGGLVGVSPGLVVPAYNARAL